MGLFGGGGGSGYTTPKLSALSVQTMGYGVPIPICYGTNRVSPTLGYSTDFKATKQASPGGKGFGGGGSPSYTYSSSVILFIGEGDIRGFGVVWRDKKIAADLTKAGFGFWKTGVYPQINWPFLDTNHATQALPYNGTALVAVSNYDLGSSGTLGNHSFEIAGHCLSAINTDQNYTDAHIKDVITDFLTNPHYGAIDARTATLTLDTGRMHDYCRARGLLISPLLSSQKPAHEYLADWAMIANAGIVWSEGVLKFIPYADENVTGNSVTFTADTTIRHSFDDDNVAEPIKPARKKAADCFNKVIVECLSRNNAYNKLPVEVKDQSSIEQLGLRPASTLTLDCICLPSVAIKVAHTQLLRGLYIRNTYAIKTWFDADLLEPLDFIHITDAALGLVNFRARVTMITDEQDGFLTITAEEAPLGVYIG